MKKLFPALLMLLAAAMLPLASCSKSDEPSGSDSKVALAELTTWVAVSPVVMSYADCQAKFLLPDGQMKVLDMPKTATEFTYRDGQGQIVSGQMCVIYISCVVDKFPAALDVEFSFKGNGQQPLDKFGNLTCVYGCSAASYNSKYQAVDTPYIFTDINTAAGLTADQFPEWLTTISAASSHHVAAVCAYGHPECD